MQKYEEYIDSLKKFISFKSVLGEKKDGMPFGEGVYGAYKYFLDLAESFGFEINNYDNYIGEISYGEGEELGIIGHVDVVPEGNGWDTDPFTLTARDGFLYGRGVTDDKGPMLSCLYALKALKDSGKKCNKKFRFFVGCNEETGWKDVEYFAKNHKFPEYGFSPDGDFPLTYAEKGILVVKFKIPALKRFHNIQGGTVVNAVCDYAACNADEGAIIPELIKRRGLNLLYGQMLESVGKSAHGSKPHLGKNAMKPFFEYFNDLGEDVGAVLDYLFYDKAGIFEMKNEQGGVTLSPGLIEEKDGEVVISCDVRIPAPFTPKDVLAKIDEFGLKYESFEKHPPVMVEKNNDFVKTLLNAYNSVMGENKKPISLGGSTFARVFEKGCSFGGAFPGSKTMHEPNERESEENVKKQYEIYEKAIFALSE